MDLSALVALATWAGFADPNLAAAIAMAESRGNAAAVGDAGDSIGLWQIDTAFHRQWSKGELEDPVANARAAYAISLGGVDWHRWSTAWEDPGSETRPPRGYLGPAAPFRRWYRAPSLAGAWFAAAFAAAAGAALAAALPPRRRGRTRASYT